MRIDTKTPVPIKQGVSLVAGFDKTLTPVADWLTKAGKIYMAAKLNKTASKSLKKCRQEYLN